MTALWKGFSSTANKRKMRARRQHGQVDNQQGNRRGNNDDDKSGSDINNEDDDDDFDEFKEDKEPMSPELYQSSWKWLLELGNLDGIFAALFIMLSWNLVCRGNNTAKIQLSHLKWSVFDALQVNFKHTKVDQ